MLFYIKIATSNNGMSNNLEILINCHIYIPTVDTIYKGVPIAILGYGLATQWDLFKETGGRW